MADLIANFQGFGLNVIVHDPIADAAEAEHEYGILLTPWQELPRRVDALVAAVSHRQYLDLPLSELLSLLKPGGVFTDIKSAYDPSVIRAAGFSLWRL